jgi:hypothetical protein
MPSMSYTLHYRSSRAEVWRWYWGAWRARLWRIHVLLAALLAGLIAYLASSPHNPWLGLVLFPIALPMVALFFAAWPQITFKSAERTLQVGPEGWVTQIGRLTGARAWNEVASVAERNGTLAITSTNGNALVVPSRAFPDRGSWERFVQDVRTWHEGQAV